MRAAYRTDGGQIVFGLPDAVVHARAPEDVADTLKYAQREGVPVTCRGGGLTTEGESVARQGVLLDLKGLSRFLDCDGSTAWVEAGMTWHQLAEHLRPLGLDYISAPLNMMSSVGGTLGVGGIDVNSPRHGCAADQAVELEVVTPTGDIVRVKDGDDYFERVILGYGQFGVITKARLKVRPYKPMTTKYWLYSDIGIAIDDMKRLVDADAVDACAILTLMDRVIALIVGFEGEPRPLELRGATETSFLLKTALGYGVRPWRWKEAMFLRRRKSTLLPALTHPLFTRGGKLEDRTVVFSRLIWEYWGDRQVVIPDLAITKKNFAEAARRGIDVCRRHFPYFTLYCVMIRKFGERPRYEMSAIPPTSDAHVCGIEFSPLLEGADYARDHFQSFKNAIYDEGLKLGGSYYRFGGVMKPYIRRMFGDAMVDRHKAMKRSLDPAFILNPEVVF
ncbi:MAG TPA: FAD-binding oxidoreductase [Planctomycetota bacterium]